MEIQEYDVFEVGGWQTIAVCADCGAWDEQHTRQVLRQIARQEALPCPRVPVPR